MWEESVSLDYKCSAEENINILFIDLPEGTYLRPKQNDLVLWGRETWRKGRREDRPLCLCA